MPAILTGIAIATFFLFTNPIFNDIAMLKTQAASYNDALNNSKALENERDTLTAKYNTIDPNNLTRLQTLLPDNVDNIRLILEIGQIAAPYGMTLTNVQYNAAAAPTPPAAGGIVVQAAAPAAAPSGYGTFNLEFSVSGSYDNFINFTKDLQNNLRIVDISSITFSSGSAASVPAKAGAPEIYTYDYKIKTYWLKN
jgi:Tfp pilus assembly protein PilO